MTAGILCDWSIYHSWIRRHLKVILRLYSILIGTGIWDAITQAGGGNSLVLLWILSGKFGFRMVIVFPALTAKFLKKFGLSLSVYKTKYFVEWMTLSLFNLLYILDMEIALALVYPRWCSLEGMQWILAGIFMVRLLTLSLHSFMYSRIHWVISEVLESSCVWIECLNGRVDTTARQGKLLGQPVCSAVH